MGWLFMALTIVCFTSLAVFMKLGSIKKADSTALTFGLYSSASVLGLVLLLLKSGNVSTACILYGIAGGIGGAVSFLFFSKALSIGHYGFSIAILSGSFLLQALFSALYLKEPANLLGIVLLLVSLFLMAYASGSDKEQKKGVWAKWFFFISLAFFLNGFPIIAQVMIPRVPDSNFFLYLFSTYIFGSLCLLPFVLKNRNMNKTAWFYGSLGGLGSFLGVFFLLLTLQYLSANIVFPVYFSAYNMLSVLISYLIFKNKIGKLGFAGICLGIIGMIVLCIKN